MNLALMPQIKPTKLLKGEKIYLVLIIGSLIGEIILFSIRRNEFFVNPLYFVAPLLLGLVKNQEYVKYGTISSEFKKSVFLLILIILFIFIWESNPENPLGDLILILLGPIIFAMIMLMFFIANLVFYSVGHILFKIFRRS
ncbi:MAG: hypothetical protein HeimC2_19110 [Candidatus Heimdallarchaeota archaeon LC_2]|nr:MAG: hypothetical protein HeimC2_19110 [Candidatus Heimdallarchaeota archaeon LC_2]